VHLPALSRLDPWCCLAARALANVGRIFAGASGQRTPRPRITAGKNGVVPTPPSPFVNGIITYDISASGPAANHLTLKCTTRGQVAPTDA
jgi:hypothetical protein